MHYAEKFSDAELAALLGHEIAHVVAEHALEEAPAVLLLNPFNPTRSLEDVLDSLNSDLATNFAIADLQRLQEQEADHIGLLLAAKAGFDPMSAIQLFGKLGSGYTVLTSHDTAQVRFEKAKGVLPRALQVFSPSKGCPLNSVLF